MTTTVIIPKEGMGTTEGTILKWYKKEGETIAEGEILVEIEFAKSVLELESPASGVLTKILLPEGETADVFTDIALID